MTQQPWWTAQEARERGEALHDVAALDDHAVCDIPQERPTLQDFLRTRNEGRLPELLPIGHRRMCASPFAFFRGSAGLMAHDLAGSPVTGIHGQICGDAHAANFGLYGTPDGRIIIDINDFDETAVGPWEWDLKRLATSLVLAGRTGRDVGDKTGLKAARQAARAYRKAVKHLAEMPLMEYWSSIGDESAIARADADALFDDFREAASDAQRNTSERAAVKLAHRHEDDEGWHFVLAPPRFVGVDDETRAAVVDALESYRDTLQRPWPQLIERYRPHDVALRVVGTGSVGMRAYVVLLEGHEGEALMLQVKQAGPSALAPYLPPDPTAHHGERIVLGSLLVQVETDPLLGWTSVGETPYLVRQFRNRKGAIDPTLLTADHLDDYGRLAGTLLARAHSRSIDPRVLAGYLRKGKAFDVAIGSFAVAYADQVGRDHQVLLDLVEAGEVEAADPED